MVPLGLPIRWKGGTDSGMVRPLESRPYVLQRTD